MKQYNKDAVNYLLNVEIIGSKKKIFFQCFLGQTIISDEKCL